MERRKSIGSQTTQEAVDLRLVLTERTISHLPFAQAGQYCAFDEKLRGLYILVGRRRKTYMVRGDLRIEGKRAATVKIAIGSADTINVNQARAIGAGYLSEIRQGRHPKPKELKRQSHIAEIAEDQQIASELNVEGPTLQQAWERYKKAMIKKGRSARTIAGYEDHVVRVFKSWVNKPIKSLAEHPDMVSKKHDAITDKSGPYAANGAMRTLRAIYNHAWLKNKKALPRDNPVDAVDWNRERRRNTGMGVSDLPGWFKELAELENPVRREFHLLTLLSASRPAALKQARREHLDLKRRVLHIPAPKGGEDRAFDIPLSRQMICSLMRVIRFGRVQHPIEARVWLFPAESETGHMYVTQEDRDDLSKWGNDLRQTYRTLAAVAKVNGVDAKLLMNHAIPGVNEGYITREKILEDHLREQQQAITDVIFTPIRDALERSGPIRTWLAPRAARTGIAAAAQIKSTGSRLRKARRDRRDQLPAKIAA